MKYNDVSIKVACLPVAGIENPYQYLMLEGLNSDCRLHAFNGIDDRFFGIMRTAIRYRPDYIHFDWITSYYFRKKLWMTILNIPLFIFQILVVRYVFTIKIVWTLHNIQPHDTRYIGIHSICRRFFASHVEWIRVFARDTGERARNCLQINSRFIVCPEGSYRNYYGRTMAKSEARDKLGIVDNPFVFLYLGFVKPYKGIEDLISAFNLLEVPNVKLIVAGKSMNDEYSASLSCDNHNIIFVNRFIESEELSAFYSAADVCVLPFKKIENSGSAILAMGFGKVVIAIKQGVLKTRLSKQSQFLYEDDNLLDKMRDALLERSRLEEIGKINIQEVEKYSWEEFANHFL